MKPLSTTRTFCVPQHPQPLCALPFYKPRLSTFSSLLFAKVMRFRYLFHLLGSSVVLCRTAWAHLDTSPSLD
jgi:hypothetical protein